jgi:hypothetical protein
LNPSMQHLTKEGERSCILFEKGVVFYSWEISLLELTLFLLHGNDSSSSGESVTQNMYIVTGGSHEPHVFFFFFIVLYIYIVEIHWYSLFMHVTSPCIDFFPKQKYLELIAVSLYFDSIFNCKNLPPK